MKQCIAVTEILRRIVVVDTKEAGTDGLENAIERVKEAYKAQEVILDAGDLVPDPVTGEPACFAKQTGLIRTRFRKWMLISRCEKCFCRI